MVCGCISMPTGLRHVCMTWHCMCLRLSLLHLLYLHRAIAHQHICRSNTL